MKRASPKARPILMTGPMVVATLADLKTQTRRLVKFREFGRSDTPGYDWHFRGTRRGATRGSAACLWQDLRHSDLLDLCPYGRVGDRLWVRESLVMRADSTWTYKADGAVVSLPEGHPDTCWMLSWALHQQRDYCPSIHMPRWASRISLELLNVRIERLQEITEADAVAEGLRRYLPRPDGPTGPDGKLLDRFHWESSDRATRHDPVLAYRDLWDSINGKRASWDSNPYVWVLEYRRLEGRP